MGVPGADQDAVVDDRPLPGVDPLRWDPLGQPVGVDPALPAPLSELVMMEAADEREVAEPMDVRIAVRGCDHFEFRDGLIVRKDSYWKIVG